MVLSLAHYFEQNGDLCQDPEMEVRVTCRRMSIPAASRRHLAGLPALAHHRGVQVDDTNPGQGACGRPFTR